ncbi:MAG: orotidine-5'-phosphate decarboxylase [Acidobacteriota bacterium]
MATESSFADRVIGATRRLEHPLCVGLDPHLGQLPPLFRRGSMNPDEPTTAEAVEDFFFAVIDRIADRVAVVKPQVAFFEQLGWRGLRALGRVIARARQRGLLVLIDAKRGDIGSTAAAYARAHLGPDAPFAGDALTVHPYLGLDSLEPFIERCSEVSAGLFVLVRTSNPGAGTLQDLEIAGQPLFHRVAETLAPAAEKLRGAATGWSSLGVVLGATWPGQAEAVRRLLPHSLVLVPGYGAQGASAQDAVRSFTLGPGGRRLEGGLVNSSRGILFPKLEGESSAAWERAFDAGLARAIDELSRAVAP